MTTWQRHEALDARLRATLDTVHDAVIVIDERGIVIDANRAVATLFGRAPRVARRKERLGADG